MIWRRVKLPSGTGAVTDTVFPPGIIVVGVLVVAGDVVEVSWPGLNVIVTVVVVEAIVVMAALVQK